MSEPLRARRSPTFAIGGGVVTAILAGVWLSYGPSPESPDGEAPSEVASAAAHAIDPASSAPPPEAGADVEPADLGGLALRRVLLEVTNEEGQPIGAAEVAVVKLGGSTPAGRTDASGVVELSLPRPMPVKVAAAGYQGASFASPPFGEAPEVFWSVKLKRNDDAVLTGLIHIGGQGIEKAMALLLADPPGESKIVFTAAEGRFRFADLPARPQAVIALHSGYGEARVDLDEGAREVALELPAPGFVEGTVTDPSGAPLPSFSVRLRPRGNQASPDVSAVEEALSKRSGRKTEARWLSSGYGRAGRDVDVQDAAGAFRAGPVMGGTVDVVAYAPGYEPDVREGVEVAAGRTVKGLRFVLRGPTLVRGRVTDAVSGAPVANAVVRATGSPAAGVPGFGQTRTAADGAYEVNIAGETRQRLRVSAKGYLDFEVGGIEGRRGEILERDVTLSPAKGAGRGTREYVGIGATVKKVADGVMVLDTIEGGAAARELSEGDVIVRVDQTWVDDLPLPEAIELLVGEANTDVDVLVHRRGPDGQLQEVEVALRRARLRYSTN